MADQLRLVGDAEEYRAGFGESIQQTLDLNTWTRGTDLGAIGARIEREIRAAIANERPLQRRLREMVFPAIVRTAPPELTCAGVQQAERPLIEQIYRGLLFNGGVEAANGTSRVVDTLPVTIYQTGVGLTSYKGNQNTWGHRLFRRDLQTPIADPVEELVQLLERRSHRSGMLLQSPSDHLSRFAQRGIMAYAERALLLRQSTAVWRLGHGNPAPPELLSGSGFMDLMVEGTRLIREFVESYPRFVFVGSEPRERLLLSIGQALRPFEYAIVDTLQSRIDSIVARSHFPDTGVTVSTQANGMRLSPQEWIQRFRDEVGPQIAVGVYRSGLLAPPHVFYAHVEHAHEAAHIVLADSALQDLRGFPLLLELAETLCRGVFGKETLSGPVADGFAAAGAPFAEFNIDA